MKEKGERHLMAGKLVYIPSEVRLVQYDSIEDAQRGATQHVKKCTHLPEPIIAPIIETTFDEVKIYYNGSSWWTLKVDAYEVVSSDTLGDILS